MSVIQEISQFLQRGRGKQVAALVQQALDEGIAPKTILDEGLLEGMNIIGEKFKNNEVFVPEVMIAARAMNAGTAVLKPYLKSDDAQANGVVVIGTVKGDQHDIGKNLVRMMMEGKGLKVIDLGVNVSAEQFVTTAEQEEADIICCSALLTTTMPEMKRVLSVLEQEGFRDKVTVMVGGAPVTESFCKDIGADIYTEDAASAADAAVEVCNHKNK